MSDAPTTTPAPTDRLAALVARVAAARPDCECDAAVADDDLRYVAKLPGGGCESAVRKLAASGCSLADLRRRLKPFQGRRGGLRLAGEDEDDWRRYLKLNDQGEPRGTLDNALAILRNAYDGRLSYDMMGLQPCLDGRPLDDAGVTRLRGEVGAVEALNGHACTVQVGDFRAALIAVAEEQRTFSPVADYLRGPSCQWDGKPRLWTMARDHLLLPDPYSNRALGRVWVSAAARGLVWEDPISAVMGCMVKTIPIFLGWQDAKKSTMNRVMGGRWYGDTRVDIEDPKRSTMVLGSCWIYEWPEIDGLLTRGNNEGTKSWSGSSLDRMVPNFATSVSIRPRSFIVTGTTNKPKFLTDTTGSARWWVFDLRPHGTRWEVDEEKLAAERDQILAEAVHELDLYRARLVEGVRGDKNPHRWWMSKNEAAERERRNASHQVESGWAEVLGAWLAGAEVSCGACKGTGGPGQGCQPCTGLGRVAHQGLPRDDADREYVTVARLQAEVLGVPVERWTKTRGDVADALAALGWRPGEKLLPRLPSGRKGRAYVTPFYCEAGVVDDAVDAGGGEAATDPLRALPLEALEARQRAIGPELRRLDDEVERRGRILDGGSEATAGAEGAAEDGGAAGDDAVGAGP